MATLADPKSLLARIPPVAWVFIAVVLTLVGGYLVFLRTNFTPLYSDLRPSEAAAVVGELEKQGVRYRLANGGSEILAPSAEADAIRLRLASSATSLNGEHGFELFDTNDLGLTDFAQKVRYQRALQGELSRTIMMMDGVADARVHLSIPERTVFRGERRNAEAAVTLIMRSAEAATPARIEGVQRLVAASLPDLTPSDVVVLNGRGEVISIMPDPPPTAAFPAHNSEQNISRIVRNILGAAPFEIAIQATPPPLAGDSYDATMPPGPDTIINITTADPVDPDATERIIGALEAARLVDPSDGRSVAFRVRATPPSEPAPAPNPATRPVVEAAVSPAPLMNLLPIALALALIAAVGVTILRTRKGAKTSLSADEHTRFADHLRAVLASDGERHG